MRNTENAPLISSSPARRAIFGALAALGIAACGDDAPVDAYEPPAVGITVKYPEVCNTDPTEKICGSETTVTRTVELANTPNPPFDVDSITLSRPEDGLEAKGSLPAAQPEAGTRALNLSYAIENIDGFELRDCAGGPAPVEVPANTTEICVELAKAENGGTGGGTPVSTTGDACVKFADAQGTAIDAANCTVTLNGEAVTSDGVPEGQSCDGGVFMDDKAVGTYTAEASCAVGEATLTGTGTVTVSPDVQNNSTVTVEAEPVQPSGVGAMCEMANASDGTPIADETACITRLDGNAVTPVVDLVNCPEGALVGGMVPNKNYEVEVTCAGETHIRTVSVADSSVLAATPVTFDLEAPVVTDPTSGYVCITAQGPAPAYTPEDGCDVFFSGDKIPANLAPIGTCDDPGDSYFAPGTVADGAHTVTVICPSNKVGQSDPLNPVVVGGTDDVNRTITVQ